jgi:large subunit ribosomal protein L4
MMDVQVITPGSKTKDASMTLNDLVFARDFNEGLIHQVVTAYMAGARQGTKRQKNRSDMGKTAKPWRQKGTGRARAGSRVGPLWRGGATTFAARPRDYSQKVNRSMYRGAMRSILSELIRQERLFVVNDIVLADHKTKTGKAWIESMNIQNALIVTEAIDTKVFLSLRNLPHVAVVDCLHLDPVSLVRYDNLVVTKAALLRIEESLA